MTDDTDIEFIPVSNADFLATVFREDKLRAFVTGFDADPTGAADDRTRAKMWGGGEVRNGGAKKIKDAVARGLNTFVTISVFDAGDDGQVRRTKSLHDGTYLIVADDIAAGDQPGPGAKWADNGVLDLVYGLEPSYILETSPGNTQWGWILQVKEDRAWLIDRIQEKMIELGLAKDAKDPGMKGVTRYVRLPNGLNTKAKYKGIAGCAEGFPCRMRKWQPEVQYTAEAIARALEVDLTAPAYDDRGIGRQLAKVDLAASDDPVLGWLEAEGLVKGELLGKPGAFDLTCPWVDEHSDGADNGTAYFAAGYVDRSTGEQYLRGGFTCHHGHCEDRSRTDLLNWLAERGHDVQGVLEAFEEVVEGEVIPQKVAANVIWADQLSDCSNEEELRRVCHNIRRSRHLDKAARDVLASIVQNLSTELMGTRISREAARELVTPKKRTLEGGTGLGVGGADGVGAAPAWAQGWVYLCRTAEFYHLDTKRRYSQRAFDFNYLHEIPEDELSASSFLGRNNLIPKLHASLYAPGNDRIFRAAFDGLEYANDHSPAPPSKPEAEWTLEDIDALNTFVRHWEEFIPNPLEREIFWDYLSYVVQHEDRRVLWALLLIGTTGDGKSSISELLGLLLGDTNVDVVNGSSIDGKFTGWAEGYRVKVIEELKMHGHNRYDRVNQIKPFIANKKISIERKGMDPYTVMNTASYIIYSNYVSAVPVEDDDRRFCLIQLRFTAREEVRAWIEQQPAGYWDRYYSALREHSGVLGEWLKNRPISATFDPYTEAPETRVKQVAREMTTSDDKAALKDIISDGRIGVSSEWISLKHLRAAFLDMDLNRIPDNARIVNLLTELGWYRVTLVGDDGAPVKKQRVHWPERGDQTYLWGRIRGAEMTTTEMKAVLDSTKDQTEDEGAE